MHSERNVTAGKIPTFGVPVLIVQTGPVLGLFRGGGRKWVFTAKPFRGNPIVIMRFYLSCRLIRLIPALSWGVILGRKEWLEFIQLHIWIILKFSLHSL
jgi:hypothetical protein